MLFIVLLSCNNAYSQTRQSLEEQRKQALKEIEETNRFLRETVQSQKESVEKLNLLNAQVTQFNRLISSINAEIAYFDRQIDETSVNISRMNLEIEKMKAEYAALVFQAYKNRGFYNELIYVLSSKDFNEAYRRVKYFQQYSDFRKKQVTEIVEKQKELSIVIDKLTEQKKEKDLLLAEHRQESEKLEAVKIEQDKEVIKWRSQERKLREQLAAQQKKERMLQNEIEKLIADEAKKRNTTTSNIYDKLTPEELLISNSFKGNKGKLPWPVEKGSITGFFGVHTHPLFKDVRPDNSGVDITTVGGADVRAIYDGEVSSVGGILGDNIFVVLRHGNYITVYQNLVEVRVKMGDKVKLKDVIGKVYTDRGSQTAVLHFEIWEEFNKQNPEQWITKN